MSQVMKVGSKCQVVIPKKIRDQLHIKPNDELIVSTRHGQIIMQPKTKKYSEYMRGLGKELWKDVDATEYVKKERESWDN